MYTNYNDANADLVADVERFHKKFKITQREEGGDLYGELLRFRIKFLAEELKEANIAAAKADLPELLDALVDLVYVALGTAYVLNLDFQNAWRKVQEANMLKVNRSEENPGKRGHPSDVVKPAGWTAPKHDDLFIPEDLNHPPLRRDVEEGLVDLPTFMAM